MFKIFRAAGIYLSYFGTGKYGLIKGQNVRKGEQKKEGEVAIYGKKLIQILYTNYMEKSSNNSNNVAKQ